MILHPFFTDGKRSRMDENGAMSPPGPPQLGLWNVVIVSMLGMMRIISSEKALDFRPFSCRIDSL
jgi:hypothetical protein